MAGRCIGGKMEFEIFQRSTGDGRNIFWFDEIDGVVWIFEPQLTLRKGDQFISKAWHFPVDQVRANAKSDQSTRKEVGSGVVVCMVVQFMQLVCGGYPAPILYRALAELKHLPFSCSPTAVHLFNSCMHHRLCLECYCLHSSQRWKPMLIKS
jgi:hypothetical protein